MKIICIATWTFPWTFEPRDKYWRKLLRLTIHFHSLDNLKNTNDIGTRLAIPNISCVEEKQGGVVDMGDRMVVRQPREKNKDLCPTPERHSIRAMPAVTCLTKIMQREYRLEFCHLDFSFGRTCVSGSLHHATPCCCRNTPAWDVDLPWVDCPDLYLAYHNGLHIIRQPRFLIELLIIV